MKSLAHLSDAVLRRDLIQAVFRDRAATADLLAHIAEFDSRKLYVAEGYSSMHAYCVEELRLSEDAAAKRIQAARAARKFPDLLAALAEGRLHLTAVCLLAPHLTERNVGELIEAATHQRKTDVEMLLARRFPAPEAPATVRAVSTVSPLLRQHAPAHVGPGGLFAPETLDDRRDGEGEHEPSNGHEHAPAHVGNAEHAPAHVESECAITERFLVQVTIGKGTHEKLRYAQALLSHSVRSGDVAQVLDRALDALIADLEKRKIGAGGQGGIRPVSRRGRKCSSSHYIPAQIRRAVWERDGGQCTFVSKGGHRCGERCLLEFDHVEPVARGGTATVNGIRLRCRAHNQYGAEQVFGAAFMSGKRNRARTSAMPRPTHALDSADERRARVRDEQAQDVVAGLRGLGCRIDEARRAAEFAEGATLGERMRAALTRISRRRVQTGGAAVEVRT